MNWLSNEAKVKRVLVGMQTASDHDIGVAMAKAFEDGLLSVPAELKKDGKWHITVAPTVRTVTMTLKPTDEQSAAILKEYMR